MAGISFRVEGLREMQKKLSAAPDNVYIPAVRAALKEVGDVATSAAKRDAPVVSGRLRKRIRPRVRIGKKGKIGYVEIKSDAVRRGFGYPKRLEFEDVNRQFGRFRESIMRAKPSYDRALRDAAREVEKAWAK